MKYLLALFLLPTLASAADTYLTSDRWACQAPGCTEVCRYKGTIDKDDDKTFSVETHFTRGEELVQLRVKVKVDTHYWLAGKVGAYADETTYFDAQTGKPLRYDNNTRLVVGGDSGEEEENIEWQGWSRNHFDWNAKATSSYLIQGKSLAELNGIWPTFAKHWPLTSFGNDWQAGFEAAGPHRRTDHDVKKLNELSATPGYLSFYLPRFLQVGELNRAELVLGKENEGKTISIPMKSRMDSRSGKMVISTSLKIGELYSPDDEPSEITINPANKQIEGIYATFTHDMVMGTYRARMTPLGCEVR